MTCKENFYGLSSYDIGIFKEEIHSADELAQDFQSGFHQIHTSEHAAIADSEYLLDSTLDYNELMNKRTCELKK